MPSRVASDVGRAFGVTHEQPKDELRPPLFLLRPNSPELWRTGRTNLPLQPLRGKPTRRYEGIESRKT